VKNDGEKLTTSVSTDGNLDFTVITSAVAITIDMRHTFSAQYTPVVDFEMLMLNVSTAGFALIVTVPVRGHPTFAIRAGINARAYSNSDQQC
jgi:hypothetical protein